MQKKLISTWVYCDFCTFKIYIEIIIFMKVKQFILFFNYYYIKLDITYSNIGPTDKTVAMVDLACYSEAKVVREAISTS